ncbi:glutamate receptor ionotropic, delta-2-like [Cherax quadricarinatus]|uniref:glutamate receptor ionotropic, delta-2-like n=1 Tax=Cherax quadricarinatus TaxID=27406 RepID=UPI00387ED798
MISEAKRLRQVSWCVTVVVVSDDTVFLAAFAEWSLKGRFLVWSTRLLLVTHLPLQQLQQLHATFSMTNSMLLIIKNTASAVRCSIFIHLPFSLREAKALKIASWTAYHGLTLATNLSLFPDKFSPFIEKPTLAVAVDQTHVREIQNRKTDDMMDYFAHSINFTYKYVLSRDGSLYGLVEMIRDKEADFAVDPFSLSADRAEMVDFMWPTTIQYSRILAGRSLPEVDPWGFLLPLDILVWVTVLMTLLVLLFFMFLVLWCLSHNNVNTHDNWKTDAFNLLRVLLQQDCLVSGSWWWKRLMFLLWMMMISQVLIKSYSGNLMSSLAVKYISQPYQTLRDLLDDTSATLVWQKDSVYGSFLNSGMYREVYEPGYRRHIIYQTLFQFFNITDTLVRHGSYAIFQIEILINIFVSQDFSRTGRCDFYTSRERFLPTIMASIAHKDSPLIPAFNKRILSMTEAGLYYQWLKISLPNSTSCEHPPTKITVSSSLSLNNIWGMFVILGGGLILSTVIFCLEIVTNFFILP